MSRIGAVVDVERNIALLIDTSIFYMQKIRQHNFSAADREKALADIEQALPMLKRLLWKIKNLEDPITAGKDAF